MVCETRIGASPTEGSSTSRSLGEDISARPIASICCWPPESEPASWRLRSASTGKISNEKARFLPMSGRAGLRKAPSRRFSSTLSVAMVPEGRRLFPKLSVEENLLLGAELGKQSPSLGHHGHAQVDDLLRRQAGQVMGFSIQVETDRAARGADHAHDAFHERALAVAVGAEQRHGFALPDSNRHAVERAHRAVSGVYCRDPQLKRQGRLSALRGS